MYDFEESKGEGKEESNEEEDNEEKLESKDESSSSSSTTEKRGSSRGRTSLTTFITDRRGSRGSSGGRRRSNSLGKKKPRSKSGTRGPANRRLSRANGFRADNVTMESPIAQSRLHASSLRLQKFAAAAGDSASSLVLSNGSGRNLVREKNRRVTSHGVPDQSFKENRSNRNPAMARKRDTKSLGVGRAHTPPPLPSIDGQQVEVGGAPNGGRRSLSITERPSEEELPWRPHEPTTPRPPAHPIAVAAARPIQISQNRSQSRAENLSLDRKSRRANTPPPPPQRTQLSPLQPLSPPQNASRLSPLRSDNDVDKRKSLRNKKERISIGDSLRKTFTGDAKIRLRDHLFDLSLPLSLETSSEVYEFQQNLVVQHDHEPKKKVKDNVNSADKLMERLRRRREVRDEKQAAAAAAAGMGGGVSSAAVSTERRRSTRRTNVM
jgi:hypothetical protein